MQTRGQCGLAANEPFADCTQATSTQPSRTWSPRRQHWGQGPSPETRVQGPGSHRCAQAPPGRFRRPKPIVWPTALVPGGLSSSWKPEPAAPAPERFLKGPPGSAPVQCPPTKGSRSFPHSPPAASLHPSSPSSVGSRVATGCTVAPAPSKSTPETTAPKKPS